MRKIVIALCSALLLTTLGLPGGRPGFALADYGQGAQYQIELSYNCNNAAACERAGLPGAVGVWLWIELNANKTGDYRGSDCLHGSPAIPDSGNVTWWDNGNGTLTIFGLNLADGHLPPLIIVSDAYGHYSFPGYPVPGFPSVGTTQLQVAP